MQKISMSIEFDLADGEKPDQIVADIAAIIQPIIDNFAVAGSTKISAVTKTPDASTNDRFAEGEPQKEATIRSKIRPGQTVDIILKRDQPTGRLTRGVVKEILTNSPEHHRGIKVRLADGRVGRIHQIIESTTI